MMVPDGPTNHNGTLNKVELSWDEMMAGQFPPAIPEPPVRQAFRAAVSTVAIRAHEALPATHGRIFAAVKIVLAGDCELLPDGKAKVGSQSDGATEYYVVNGHCDCPDAQHKAPDGWCKHRLAAAI